MRIQLFNFAVACGSLLLLSGCETGSTDAGGAAAVESQTVAMVDQVVEASCGQCQFGMEGSGCDLAVRIDGKSYYVDGSSIDDHGDAHGEDGMCNCVRQATVTGEVKNGRFVATTIKVLPLEKKDPSN